MPPKRSTWTKRGQKFPQAKKGEKTKYDTDKETKDKIDNHVDWWENKTPLERAQEIERREEK